MFLWNLGSFRPLFFKYPFFLQCVSTLLPGLPLSMLIHLMLCRLSRLLSFYFHFFILFLCSSDKIISVDLSSILFFLVPNQIYCWFLMVNFSRQLLYFSNPKFLFASFKSNLFLLTLCILLDLILIDSVIM